MEQQVGELSRQELANIAWAFAAMRWSDMSLFAAVAAKARRNLSLFRESVVEETVWNTYDVCSGHLQQ